MNQHQAKKTRREMRRYFRQAGMTAEDLAVRFRLQVKPCPRWLPAFAWYALARCVLRAPTTGDLADVRGGCG